MRRFFILMLFPWTQVVLLNLTFKLAMRFKVFALNWKNWREIFDYTPTFFVKCAISGAIDGFIGNVHVYISTACSSLFWIQAYQICYDQTIPSKVLANFQTGSRKWNFLSVYHTNYNHRLPVNCVTDLAYSPTLYHISIRVDIWFLFSLQVWNRRCSWWAI